MGKNIYVREDALKERIFFRSFSRRKRPKGERRER